MNKSFSFYCVGLSYLKADAIIRGKFNLNDHAKKIIFTQAKKSELQGVLVISTCNRTEIYGYAENPFQLIKLLCDNSLGTVDDFQKVGYVYKNSQAVKHIFRVGTGLDSQILGDFEIVGQIKRSFVESKNAGLTNAFTERLINSIIQASRRIKNETELSSGTTSVSFASVRYILDNVSEISSKNINVFFTIKFSKTHPKRTHNTNQQNARKSKKNC